MASKSASTEEVPTSAQNPSGGREAARHILEDVCMDFESMDVVAPKSKKVGVIKNLRKIPSRQNFVQKISPKTTVARKNASSDKPSLNKEVSNKHSSPKVLDDKDSTLKTLGDRDSSSKVLNNKDKSLNDKESSSKILNDKGPSSKLSNNKNAPLVQDNKDSSKGKGELPKSTDDQGKSGSRSDNTEIKLETQPLLQLSNSTPVADAETPMITSTTETLPLSNCQNSESLSILHEGFVVDKNVSSIAQLADAEIVQTGDNMSIIVTNPRLIEVVTDGSNPAAVIESSIGVLGTDISTAQQINIVDPLTLPNNVIEEVVCDATETNYSVKTNAENASLRRPIGRGRPLKKSHVSASSYTPSIPSRSRRITAKMKAAWTEQLEREGHLVCGCSQTFVTVANFQTHFKYCSGKKTLQKCDYCDSMIFSTHKAIVQHMKVEHPEKAEEYIASHPEVISEFEKEDTSTQLLDSEYENVEKNSQQHKRNLRKRKLSPKEYPRKKIILKHKLQSIQNSMAENAKEFKKCVRFDAITDKINSVDSTCNFEPPSCSTAKKQRRRPFIFSERIVAENLYFEDDEEDADRLKTPDEIKDECRERMHTKARNVLNLERYKRYQEYLTVTRDWSSERKTYSRSRGSDISAENSFHQHVSNESFQENYHTPSTADSSSISLKMNIPETEINSLQLPSNTYQVLETPEFITIVPAQSEDLENRPVNIVDKSVNNVNVLQNDINSSELSFQSPEIKLARGKRITCYNRVNFETPKPKPKLGSVITYGLQVPGAVGETTELPVTFDSLVNSVKSTAGVINNQISSDTTANTCHNAEKASEIDKDKHGKLSDNTENISSPKKKRGRSSRKSHDLPADTENAKILESKSKQQKDTGKKYSAAMLKSIEANVKNKKIKLFGVKKNSKLKSRNFIKTSKSHGKHSKLKKVKETKRNLIAKSIINKKKKTNKNKSVDESAILCQENIDNHLPVGQELDSISQIPCLSVNHDYTVSSVTEGELIIDTNNIVGEVEVVTSNIENQNAVGEVELVDSNAEIVSRAIPEMKENVSVDVVETNNTKGTEVMATNLEVVHDKSVTDDVLLNIHSQDLVQNTEQSAVDTMEKANDQNIKDFSENKTNSNLIISSKDDQIVIKPLSEDDQNVIKPLPEDDQSVNKPLPENDQNVIKPLPENDQNIIKPSSEDNLNVIKSTLENDQNVIKSTLENDQNVIRPSPEDDQTVIKPSSEDNQNVIEPTLENEQNVIRPSSADDQNIIRPSSDDGQNVIKSSSEDNQNAMKPSTKDNQDVMKPSLEDNQNVVKPSSENNQNDQELTPHAENLEVSVPSLHNQEVEPSSNQGKQTEAASSENIQDIQSVHTEISDVIADKSLQSNDKELKSQDVSVVTPDHAVSLKDDKTPSESVGADDTTEQPLIHGTQSTDQEKELAFTPEVKVKRGRGRPKKNANKQSPLNVSSDGVKQDVSKTEKSRDKVMIDQINVETPSEQVQFADNNSSSVRKSERLKRRKVMSEELVQTPVIKPIQKEELTPSTPVIRTGRRGRPRKYPPKDSPAELSVSITENNNTQLAVETEPDAIDENLRKYSRKGKPRKCVRYADLNSGLESSESLDGMNSGSIGKDKPKSTKERGGKNDQKSHVTAEGKETIEFQDISNEQEEVILPLKKRKQRQTKKDDSELENDKTGKSTTQTEILLSEEENKAKSDEDEEISGKKSKKGRKRGTKRKKSGQETDTSDEEWSLADHLGKKASLRKSSRLVIDLEESSECSSDERNYSKVGFKKLKDSSSSRKTPTKFISRDRCLEIETLIYSLKNSKDVLTDYKPQKWMWKCLNCEDYDIVPPLKKSVFFKVESQWKNSETYWNSLNLFDSAPLDKDSCHYTFFTGGPVTCSAWCPVPVEGDKVQHVALAVNHLLNKVHSFVCEEPEKGSVQLWNMGVMTDKTLQRKPFMEMSIFHEYGPINDLAWCPAGCWEDPAKEFPNDVLPRLGILALACSDSNVRIYSIPHPNLLSLEENCDRTYSCSPSIVLEPIYGGVCKMTKKSICVSLAWQKTFDCERLAAGYGNGMICIWNLNSSATILVSKENHHTVISPYCIFNAHGTPVLGLSFSHHLGERYLVSSSIDKTLKFWDLVDTSLPLISVKKGPGKFAQWSTVYCGAFGSIEFGMNNIKGATFYKECGTDSFPSKAMSNSCGSVVISAFSEFLNAQAIADIAGKVTVSFPLSMLQEHSKTPNFYHRLVYGSELKPVEGMLEKIMFSSYPESLDSASVVKEMSEIASVLHETVKKICEGANNDKNSEELQADESEETRAERQTIENLSSEITDVVSTLVDMKDTTEAVLDMEDATETMINLEEITDIVVNMKDTVEVTSGLIDTFVAVSGAVSDMQNITETVLDIQNVTEAVLDMEDCTRTVSEMSNIIEVVLHMKDCTEAILDMEDASKAVLDMKAVTAVVSDVIDSVETVLNEEAVTKAILDMKITTNVMLDMNSTVDVVSDVNDAVASVEDLKDIALVMEKLKDDVERDSQNNDQIIEYNSQPSLNKESVLDIQQNCISGTSSTNKNIQNHVLKQLLPKTLPNLYNAAEVKTDNPLITKEMLLQILSNIQMLQSNGNETPEEQPDRDETILSEIADIVSLIANMKDTTEAVTNLTDITEVVINIQKAVSAISVSDSTEVDKKDVRETILGIKDTASAVLDMKDTAETALDLNDLVASVEDLRDITLIVENMKRDVERTSQTNVFEPNSQPVLPKKPLLDTEDTENSIHAIISTDVNIKRPIEIQLLCESSTSNVMKSETETDESVIAELLNDMISSLQVNPSETCRIQMSNDVDFDNSMNIEESEVLPDTCDHLAFSSAELKTHNENSVMSESFHSSYDMDDHQSAELQEEMDESMLSADSESSNSDNDMDTDDEVEVNDSYLFEQDSNLSDDSILSECSLASVASICSFSSESDMSDDSLSSFHGDQEIAEPISENGVNVSSESFDEITEAGPDSEKAVNDSKATEGISNDLIISDISMEEENQSLVIDAVMADSSGGHFEDKLVPCDTVKAHDSCSSNMPPSSKIPNQMPENVSIETTSTNILNDASDKRDTCLSASASDILVATAASDTSEHCSITESVNYTDSVNPTESPEIVCDNNSVLPKTVEAVSTTSDVTEIVNNSTDASHELNDVLTEMPPNAVVNSEKNAISHTTFTAYEDVVSQYGIVFKDMETAKFETVEQRNFDEVNECYLSQCHLPSIKTVSWNPNYGSHFWLLSAGTSGIARVSYVSDIKKLTSFERKSK